MSRRKAVLDTNVYIESMNNGRYQDLMSGEGLMKYLAGVVLMELRTGATTLRDRRELDQLIKSYQAVGRIVVPDANAFDQAGRTLQKLRKKGREIKGTSLTYDVLIAHSARSIGATVYTNDRDYEAIRSVLEFDLVLV